MTKFFCFWPINKNTWSIH